MGRASQGKWRARARAVRKNKSMVERLRLDRLFRHHPLFQRALSWFDREGRWQ